MDVKVWALLQHCNNLYVFGAKLPSMPEGRDDLDNDDPSRSGAGVSQGPRSFTKTSPFVELFSTKTRVEITDALLRNSGLRLPASEIADLAGRHRTGFYRHKDVLEELGILRPVGQEDGTQLYQLNDTDVTYHLREAQAALVERGNSVTDVMDAENEEIEELPREARPPEPEEGIAPVETESIVEPSDPAGDIRQEIMEKM